jgi:hypothetical protein
MAGFVLALDLLIIAAALTSAWLWRAASRHRLRRISGTRCSTPPTSTG